MGVVGHAMVVGHGGGPAGLTGPQEQVVVDTLPELLLLSLDSTSITSTSFYIPVHDQGLLLFAETIFLVGTRDATKTHEFSEKFQTAFDPPRSFSESYVAIFF